MYDIVVVGLGVMGLSTLYYCAKTYPHLKVLGIEKNPVVGMIGTSSYGHTRVYRIADPNMKYQVMMEEGFPLWREIEKESGRKLLFETGALAYGHKDSAALQSVMKNTEGEKMDAKEIMRRFPALKMPDDYIGQLLKSTGVIKARETLYVLEKLSKKHGAEILYNKDVKSIRGNKIYFDETNYVESKKIIMTCGKESPKFVKNDIKTIEIEYFTLDDPSGLPPVMIEYDDDSCPFYGVLDGDKLDKYKVSLNSKRNAMELFEKVRTRMPEKMKHLMHSTPCFYTQTPSNDFIVEQKGDVTYGYSFSGHGFKHSMLMGKMIGSLTMGKQLVRAKL